jgi:hypothetical protein
VGLHHASRYTVYGSQLVDQHIQRDLRFVVHFLCERWPADFLQAIVLTGSYGRGEGGVQRKKSQEFPFDDYDLLLVFKRLNATEKKRIQATLPRICELISEKTAIPVDIAPVCDLEDLMQAPFNLSWYMFRHGHKLIWGQLDLLDTLSDYPVEHLPVSEAFQLLLHSGVRLLEVINAGCPLIEPWNDSRWPLLLMALHNAVIALGDALLIFNRCYSHSYSERIQILKSLLQQNPSLPDAHLLAYLYPEAIQYKLSPSEYRNLPVELVVGKLEIVRKMFLKYWLLLVEDFFLWHKNAISDFKAWVQFMQTHPPSLFERWQNLHQNWSLFGAQTIWSGWNWHSPETRFWVAFPYLLSPEDFQVGPELTGVFPGCGSPPDFDLLQTCFKHYWQKLA